MEAVGKWVGTAVGTICGLVVILALIGVQCVFAALPIVLGIALWKLIF